MNKDALIQITDVSVRLGERDILENISVEIEKGGFYYLVGQTGAGKSTFLKLLYADCPFHAGSIELGPFNIGSLLPKEIPYLRRKLGIVFQDFQLLPDRTVADNILFALRATGWTSRARIKARITEVLMLVGMWAKANARPHQLSGGEQQRVSIARALINEPSLLIADEPTGNLDPDSAQYLMKLLRKINQGGTTILMATHEYALLRSYPAKVLELKDRALYPYDHPREFLQKFLKPL
ncbi:MAG: ATP-binding cassette domain-containing protein [Bacteroidota bacterium]